MPEPSALQRPASPGEVFRAFHWMALQGFGGVLAVAQRELVERRRWLDREQFLELLALGQVLSEPAVQANFVELRRLGSELADVNAALDLAEDAWLTLQERAPA